MNAIDPTVPQDVDALEEVLSQPTDGAVRAMRELPGDLIILGVGGKMGPTLARMAVRASAAAGVPRRVIGVSRFSQPDLQQRLEKWGVETIACDLLDEAAVAQLPRAPLVVFMTGMKFGATDNPALTWAMNCYVPALVSRHFHDSRLAVFSSGNVYGLTPVHGGGSRETDELQPIGEYAVTVLGRERMFEHFSRQLDIRLVLLRLNYATELRYGVLVDLAQQVHAEQPVDVSMGYANVIWQAEANAMALESLLHATCPPLVLNIAGPDLLSIREAAGRFGELLNKPVRIRGEEAADAFLSNAEKSYQLFERPQVPVERMIRWTADWVQRGGASLGKPTHFESRDGKY